MIKYVLIMIGIILAILGLAELLHGIRLFCVSPKKKARTYSVVFLDNSYAEQQLNFAIEQFTWMGNLYAEKLIAVNTDLNEENQISCRYIAEKSGVTYCEKSQLQSVFAEVKNK